MHDDHINGKLSFMGIEIKFEGNKIYDIKYRVLRTDGKILTTIKNKIPFIFRFCRRPIQGLTCPVEWDNGEV